MAAHGDIQARILKIIGEKAEPTELWSTSDLMAEPELKGLTKIQVSNSLTYAYELGKVFKHKIKIKHGAGQYALEIHPNDRYVAGATTSGGGKKKGQKTSAKEIRYAFADLQRSIARLEDLIMPVIENAEEKDKALAKLKSIL